LTIEEIEQLALAHNPSLLRAQAIVDAARGNWVQVGLRNNPSIGYVGEQLGSGGLAEQHGFLVQQEFIRGCKRQLNRAVAEQEIVAAQQMLAAQEQRVLTDVRLAFVEAILAERRLELTHDLASLARQGVQAVDELRKVGESTRIDQLQAGMESQSAEILVVSAENRQLAARRSLAAVIGIPELPARDLTGDLETIPEEQSWPDCLERLLTTSPEIATAAANIERSRWALQRALAEPIPNWTIQGVVMTDNGIGGKTDGIVQMTLPLPLFNRNQGAIQQSQAAVVAAEHAMAQLELRLQNQLAPLYERYASAANQVRKYRQSILPAAHESLELVRQGHKAGEFPFLNLLNAQRTYFQTNLQYLDALRELRLAAIEIDGLLLRGSQEQ
jgi:cobalt-zinc-cadmium efflux system outer membrane protein